MSPSSSTCRRNLKATVTGIAPFRPVAKVRRADACGKTPQSVVVFALEAPLKAIAHLPHHSAMFAFGPDACKRPTSECLGKPVASHGDPMMNRLTNGPI